MICLLERVVLVVGLLANVRVSLVLMLPVLRFLILPRYSWGLADSVKKYRIAGLEPVSAIANFSRVCTAISS